MSYLLAARTNNCCRDGVTGVLVACILMAARNKMTSISVGEPLCTDQGLPRLTEICD